MGENPLVTAFISSLIKQDLLDHGKRGVRYGDTWDATLVFDYWMEQPVTAALSYSQLLDKTISLARIHMCSRSSDIATLWFGERSNGRTVEFLFGDDGTLIGVKIRYFMPKTGRYLAFSNGFTAWETFLVDDGYPAEVNFAVVFYAMQQRVYARGAIGANPAAFLSVRKGDGLRGRAKGLHHAQG
jgi:hypothetical protein